MMACSSAPSHAEEFYNLLRTLYGPQMLFAKGSYAEAKLYAWAMGLGRALYELEHAGNQAYPLRAYDLLPLLELDFQLTPGPSDDVPTRQQAVAVAELFPLGAGPANVVAGLRAILGASYVDFVVADHSGAGAGFAPTNFPTVSYPLGDYGPNFADIRVPARVFRLLDPITPPFGTSTPTWSGYANLDATATPEVLYPGDVVMVGGENELTLERVAVSATSTIAQPGVSSQEPAGTTVWAASTAYVPGQFAKPTAANDAGFFFVCDVGGTSGATEPAWPVVAGQTVADGDVTWRAAGASYCFLASFLRSKDVGSSITTGNFPFWMSTQRYSWIVCKPPASRDAETRRKVHAFMSNTMRGVSEWAIIEPNP
jgi:hypothetical protein